MSRKNWITGEMMMMPDYDTMRQAIARMHRGPSEEIREVFIESRDPLADTQELIHEVTGEGECTFERHETDPTVWWQCACGKVPQSNTGRVGWDK